MRIKILLRQLEPLKCLCWEGVLFFDWLDIPFKYLDIHIIANSKNTFKEHWLLIIKVIKTNIQCQ